MGPEVYQETETIPGCFQVVVDLGSVVVSQFGDGSGRISIVLLPCLRSFVRFELFVVPVSPVLSHRGHNHNPYPGQVHRGRSIPARGPTGRSRDLLQSELSWRSARSVLFWRRLGHLHQCQGSLSHAQKGKPHLLFIRDHCGVRRGQTAWGTSFREHQPRISRILRI